jgi:cell division protein FtsA
LAVAETVFDNRQKDLGAALINMGATTTSLSVYEEGNLLHTAILPIGSDHITNDIAIGLRCPINLAERIKVEYGHSESDAFTKKDEVDVSQLVKEEKISDNINLISLKYVAEIIEARVEEIFEKVDEELKKIDRSGMLPAGAVLVGGGSMLQGIVETAKRKLRLPVSLGEAKNVKIAIDKARNPEFLTALGLVAWGGHSLPNSTPNPLKKNISNAFSKVKGFIGKMMPQ